MAQWLVRLLGERFDLDDLPTWFAEPELKILEEESMFWLASSDFDALQTPEQVKFDAEQKLEAIAGAARLFQPNICPPQLAAVVRKHDDGRKEGFVYFAATIQARSTVSVRPSSDHPTSQQPATVPAQWAALARIDPNIGHALRLIGKGALNWGDLSKIFEYVENSVGGRMFALGWVTKRAINRFNQTANSAAAVGDEARHAYGRTPAPIKAMELGEARELIRRLVRSWLDARLSGAL